MIPLKNWLNWQSILLFFTPLAVLMFLGSCGGGPQLEFPPYPPAEEYLEFQDRNQRRPPPPILKNRYSAENQIIFDNLESRKLRAEAEVIYKEEQRRLTRNRARQKSQARWDRYQNRLRKLHAAERQNAIIRQRNMVSSDISANERLENYRLSLAQTGQLQREQERLRKINASRAREWFGDSVQETEVNGG